MKKRKKLVPKVKPLPNPPVDFYNQNEKKIGKAEKMTTQNRTMINFYFGDAKFDKYKAYRMAKYEGRGNSGRVSAVNLFNKTLVRAEVKRRELVLRNKQGLSTELILQELSEIVMSDMRDFFDKDGLLKPLKKLTPAQGRMIAQLETIESLDGVGFVRKIKRDQRLKALELLMKYKGMLDKEEKEGDIRGGLFVQVVLDKD